MGRLSLHLLLMAGGAIGVASPSGAAEPWLGRWVTDRKFCVDEGDTGETMPLIIRRGSIEWFVARCTYRGSTRRGNRWHIQARCSAEGETATTPIALQMRGDRLAVTWNGSPVGERQRCP